MLGTRDGKGSEQEAYSQRKYEHGYVCLHPVGDKDSLLPCKPVVTCAGHRTVLAISFSDPQFGSFLANMSRFNSLAEGGIQRIRKRTGK